MRISSVIPAVALIAAASFPVQAQNSHSNAGAVINITAAKTAPKPFTGECAAVTKAKFAGYMHRGGGLDCGFGGQIGPSRNLADFTHPATGVYCFLPARGAGFSKNNKLNAVYPTVDIEWRNSSGVMLLAYVLEPSATSGNGCPAGYIGVKTYDFSSGPAVESDNVAFYLKAN